MSTFELEDVGLPDSDDKEEWKKFWKSKNQPWRTEPEISQERQNDLTKRREIEPDVKQGVYPFKDIKLSRADIEWLLSTHDDNRGPVDWNNESQRERWGLDLRGADLRNEDLSELPLANILFGMISIEVNRNMIGNVVNARAGAQLQGARLVEAQLQGADFSTANLQGANLFIAQLQEANLYNTQLQEANLTEAQLQGADLTEAQLQGADLYRAQLQNTNLTEAQLQGAKLDEVILAYADHIGPKLADVQWGDANLAVVDWSRIAIIGDEYETLRELGNLEYDSVASIRILDYKIATRAYRQLSVALHNQGLNEDAARFAFRAQRMQRKLFWYQHKFGQYLFSGFLNLLAGYGYRFWRSFVAYALVIAVFAAIYFHIGPHLVWYESIVISMTAFHGRGFFPTPFNPGDLQAVFAAIEAFVGLFIEITLIATLTQRLFGR